MRNKAKTIPARWLHAYGETSQSIADALSQRATRMDINNALYGQAKRRLPAIAEAIGIPLDVLAGVDPASLEARPHLLMAIERSAYRRLGGLEVAQALPLPLPQPSLGAGSVAGGTPV